MIADATAESTLVGTVTGGYRVLSRIGSGTMGHVYEAQDVSTARRVALKILHKSHQKELAARFLREGKTLALLSHPNIVQLVDMGQLDDGALFLATELISGSSLRTIMDGGPVEPRRALSMVRQLLDALDAAHALGVVHRDIKPENVMVADGDVIKVLDFGVAKLLADTVAGLGEANLTSIGFSIFGSALYIAPESVTGQPVDARLDLYSTGAMLFEMLAGQPPFDDEDPSVLLRKHAFEAPPTLQQVAPGRSFAPAIEVLVERALAKRPDDRYRSAADMIAAVDVAQQALPSTRVVTDPHGSAAVAPRIPDDDHRRATTALVHGPSRRKLGLVAAAAVALVGAIILVTKGSGLQTTSSPYAASAAAALPGTGAATAEQAPAHLARGHAELALGHHQQALAAYERALRAQPQLASDKELRANLLAVLKGKDSLAVILALDLLADLTPPAHDAVVAYASSGKLADARHRAFMIAERDGVADQVDRVPAWVLDLQQTSSCDERKTTIELLAGTADRRAIAALKRLRGVKCVEREAADAIARIEAAAI